VAGPDTGRSGGREGVDGAAFESLLKEFFLHGTPEEVTDQVAEYRRHGLRYIVVTNFSMVQPSLRMGMASSIPFAKILRGLRKL
jgi:phthiodiolone/phenolphthiodiolone dimycocerosates ketoreductase